MNSEVMDKLNQLERMIMVMSNMIVFDAKGAAQYLKCSVSTIYNMTARGEIKAISVGTDYRYRKCDLDSMEVQTIAAKAQAIATRKKRRVA